MSIDKISQKAAQTGSITPSGPRLVSHQSSRHRRFKAVHEMTVPNVSVNNLDDDLPPSDVPPPLEQGGDLIARGSWLQDQINKYADLEEAASKLQEIVDQIEDPKAQALLDQVNEALSGRESKNIQAEYDDYDGQERLPDQDLDGDGVSNIVDPDMDGDGLTDNFEIQAGTSYSDIDTDHDGLTDRGEIWLADNISGYQGMDPNDPDANSNGILDGLELSSRVIKNMPTGSVIGANNNSSSVDPSSTEESGVGTQSEPVLWSPAGPGDQVVSLNGNVVFKRQDDQLVISSASGDTVVNGYFGEDGRPAKKIYIRGSIDQATFHNMSSQDLDPVADDAGFAAAGVHFDSDPKTTNSTYDVFDGALPMTLSDGEMQYTMDLNPVTLKIPPVMNNQEVKRIAMVQDGNDVVLTFRGKSGDILGKARLKDGLKPVLTDQTVLIQLADNGQLFNGTDLSFRLQGGAGDDFVYGNGGTYRLGGGNDVFQKMVSESNLEQAAVVHGGDGMDIIEGGLTVDQLYGDDGDDMIYANGNGQGILNGGSGADTLATAVGQDGGHYLIDGGGGIDMTNYVGTNPAQGIEIDLKNATIAKLNELINQPGVTGAELEALKDALDKAILGELQSSETVLQTVLFGLNQKTNELRQKYGEDGNDPLYQQAVRDLTQGPGTNADKP